MSQAPATPTAAAVPAKSRNAGIDLIRVVGLVAVVGGHVFASSPLARELTYSWHMPLFFFLTGYLWNDRRSLAGEWRTRLKSLLLPYVVWVVILVALYVAFAEIRRSFDPSRVVGALLGGANAAAPFFTLWFVTTLFFVALLYRLVSRLPAWARWAVALAGLAAGFLAPHLLSHSFLGIGMALPCLIYVVAGASLKAVRERVAAPLQTGLLLLVVCGACVALQVAVPLDLKHLNLGTPLVSVAVAIGISAALVLVAEPLMRRAPARLGGAITVLALASLTVVFLHPLIMWLMPMPPELRWVRMLVVLCVPWILGVVAVYTPAATWLNGGKPRVTRPDGQSLPAAA